MKKIFLAVSTLFALAVMFSADFQNNDLVENSAFADGTCCDEECSLCVLNNESIEDHFWKASGSCKKPPKELTLAP